MALRCHLIALALGSAKAYGQRQGDRVMDVPGQMRGARPAVAATLSRLRRFSFGNNGILCCTSHRQFGEERRVNVMHEHGV